MGAGEFVRMVDIRRPRHVGTPILVVEDDPHLRGMMVLLLEEEGYPVLAVADGRDAVRRLQASRPRLVILDLDVPYITGDDVGVRIRARYGPTLPIILVTANRHGADIAEALEATYVPKPFNIDELLAVVWRCLEQVSVIGRRTDDRAYEGSVATASAAVTATEEPDTHLLGTTESSSRSAHAAGGSRRAAPPAAWEPADRVPI